MRDLLFDGAPTRLFAQAEVDDERVNLTRFPLFFPEKRDFFLENAGQFIVGATASNSQLADLFFSRRIGLSDSGDHIPILGGARLTGKIGQNSISMMDLQTDATIVVAEEVRFFEPPVAFTTMMPGVERAQQGRSSKKPAHYRHTKRTGGPIAGLSRFSNRLSLSHLHSRDGRIRTGDPLNPIRKRMFTNGGKKPCKSLVGRTICRSCLPGMPESVGMKRHNNGPNGHMNGHTRPPDAESGDSSLCQLCVRWGRIPMSRWGLATLRLATRRCRNGLAHRARYAHLLATQGGEMLAY